MRKIVVAASAAIESLFLAGKIERVNNISKTDRATVVQYARNNNVTLDWSK